MPEPLPDDPAALKALLQVQQAAFAAQWAAARETFAAERAAAEQAHQAQRAADQKAFNARLLELYEQIRLARQRQFGRRSEAHPGQLGLFDEAEAECAAAPEASDMVELPAPRPRQLALPRRRGKRQPLPAIHGHPVDAKRSVTDCVKVENAAILRTLDEGIALGPGWNLPVGSSSFVRA